jgi:hypothetical protein
MMFVAALALPGATALAQSPEARPAGTTFTSTHFPYSLVLPPGWEVQTSSQDPASDEDLFRGEGVSARVGGGPHEDLGQTVADRVEDNRAAEIALGCTSDPSMDRATTLGGAEAILWSWSCPNSHHVAINTIRDALRLRLQVNVPADRLAEAEPLLETLRTTFRFTGGAEASPGPDAIARIDDALQGTWVADWHPVELVLATLEAHGLRDDCEPTCLEGMGSATTAQHAMRFQDGEFIQYGALDGGPLEIGTMGTYRVLDDHTIEATETATLGTIQLGFTLRDDVLAFDLLTELEPVDMIPLVGIFETLPFTRMP